MPLTDRVRNIRAVPLQRLEAGQSRTLGEFYRNIIEPNLPRPETVRAWYDLLCWYVDQPDAIFFLRKYGSDRDRAGGWTRIRRGFYTAFNRGGYVFCDNFFAHYFYLLAKGWDAAPEREDFMRTLLERRFPYGSNAVRAEVNYQAFPRGPAPILNANGWKLAHLVEVNKRWRRFDPRGFTAEHFPRGEVTDWVRNDGFPVRLMGREMSEEEREFMKIHLLRLCCPINYFLVPKTGRERDRFGNNIGENDRLLQYVRFMFEQRYGDIVNEFFTRVDVPDNYPPAANTAEVVADIRYNPDGFDDVERAMEADSRLDQPLRRGNGHARPFPVGDGLLKAIRRMPRWAGSPECRAYKLIRAFLCAADDLNSANRETMRMLCSDERLHPELYIPNFAHWFADLKTEAGQSSGKVFEEIDGVVTIWQPIQATLNRYREQFLD